MGNYQSTIEVYAFQAPSSAQRLFVVRDHRRRGTATQLLDWMYTHVWVAKPVRLDVFTHNTDAFAFYRAYGFRVAVLRMEKCSTGGAAAQYDMSYECGADAIA